MTYSKNFLINYFFKFINSSPILIGFSITAIVLEYMTFSALYSFTGENFTWSRMIGPVFLIGYTFFCYFLLPVIINILFLREKLAYFGLRLPENKLTAAIFSVLSVLFLLPIFWYFATRSDFQHSYFPAGSMSAFKYILIQLIILPLYYFSEEFFFRGFLFMSLWKRIKWHSFWITELIFTVAHLGKPLLEVGVAFPVGILLNFLTLKTKSIYPAIFVHSTIGIFFNILLRYYSGS